VPTINAVGVARPSAHGQAMITTATAAVNAAAAVPPSTSHPASVNTERPSTIGTNTPETRSAKRCTSALPDCACATIRAICASAVSAPTSVARTTKRPEVLIVAPATWSPAATSTGTDSPVSIEASTADWPLSTTPSVAIFSPGRTTNSSPTFSWSTGTNTSLPSRNTLASFAPSSSNLRIASPERRLARASK